VQAVLAFLIIKFMSERKKSTKTRLLEAALDLFAEKGVRETTTKAVAERAGVNEVTLFRHFGNKHGLLLAVMEDSAVFARLSQILVEQAEPQAGMSEALKDYAKASLQNLEKVPQLVHSLLGEADRYPVENRLALGQGLAQTNRCVAKHLGRIIKQEGLECNLPPEKLASLINSLLLGYFSIASTSQEDALWSSKEDFLDSLVVLFLKGAIAYPQTPELTLIEKIEDLPASLVHSLLLKAKKQGRQEYALVYVLFGAGLSASEILTLKRSQMIEGDRTSILQINGEMGRQVPLNQWIMGKRYGAERNPLTQWLKTRKDETTTVFINNNQQPLSEFELMTMWQNLTQDIITPDGQPTIDRARQTWCVEMLVKGMSLETLSILSGINTEELQSYARRAKEQMAIEQARQLDRQNN
jgi:AcrR family transcriptional regulator